MRHCRNFHLITRSKALDYKRRPWSRSPRRCVDLRAHRRPRILFMTHQSEITLGQRDRSISVTLMHCLVPHPWYVPRIPELPLKVFFNASYNYSHRPFIAVNWDKKRAIRGWNKFKRENRSTVPTLASFKTNRKKLTDHDQINRMAYPMRVR